MESLEDLKAARKKTVTWTAAEKAANAVIAHLEGELKRVRERLEEEKLRADSNSASYERVKGKFENSYNEAVDLKSRLAECQERERRLREACEAAIRLLEDLEQSTDGFTLRLLSAALEVKK